MIFEMPPRKIRHFHTNKTFRLYNQHSKVQLLKGIPQALQIVTDSASSQLRFLQSYQQIYGLR